MFQAYILTKVAPGTATKVQKKIIQFDEVSEAELVYGEYDLILKTRTKLPEALDHFVFEKLRKIDGVTSTTTCICARSIEGES